MNPKFDNPRAFGPMFDETVSVLSVRDGVSRRVALAVSVFSEGTAEPISDGLVDTEMESVSFVAREADWPFVKSLRRGDSITRMDGTAWQVLSVRRDEIVGFIITARCVK